MCLLLKHAPYCQRPSDVPRAHVSPEHLPSLQAVGPLACELL